MVLSRLRAWDRDDRLEGFHDAQNRPCDRDDQQDLLQGVEHAAHGQGELQWPAREGEEEHDDQQLHRSRHERAQHRRCLAPPSPQQTEPQGGDQQPETVAEADEDRQGQPLPELGVEKLRLQEHARQRLAEQPVPVAREQVWNRGHARGRDLPDADAILARYPLESDVDWLIRCLDAPDLLDIRGKAILEVPGRAVAQALDVYRKLLVQDDLQVTGQLRSQSSRLPGGKCRRFEIFGGPLVVMGAGRL